MSLSKKDRLRVTYFASVVRRGAWTMDDVPEQFRDAVKEKIKLMDEEEKAEAAAAETPENE